VGANVGYKLDYILWFVSKKKLELISDVYIKNKTCIRIIALFLQIVRNAQDTNCLVGGSSISIIHSALIYYFR
jgi:hypothetical protein